MKEYLEKYKYHIGGSSIAIIVLYFLYSKFFNESEEYKEEKSNIVIQKEPDNKFKQSRNITFKNFSIHENIKR